MSERSTPTFEEIAQATAYFDHLRAEAASYETFGEYRMHVLDVRTQPGSQYEVFRQILHRTRAQRAASEAQSQILLNEEEAIVVSDSAGLEDIREPIDTSSEATQPPAVTSAKAILAAYNLASQIPKEKDKRQQTRQIVQEAAKGLYYHPEHTDVAISVWRSRETTTDSGEAPFYQKVTREFAREIEKHWERVDAKTLATLVKVYTYSPLAKETAGQVLSAYFKGPQSQTKKKPQAQEYMLDLWEATTQARYRFAEAALELLEADDSPALETLINIINYTNEEIIPLHSPFAVNSLMAVSYASDLSSREHRIGAKIQTADETFNSMATVLRIPASRYSNEELTQLLIGDSYMDRAIILARKQIERVDRIVSQGQNSRPLLSSTLNRRDFSGIEDAVKTLNPDPLLGRREKEIGAETASILLSSQFIEQNLKDNVDNFTMFSLPLETGQVLSLIFPNTLSKQTVDTIPTIIAEFGRKPVNLEFRVPHEYIGVGVATSAIQSITFEKEKGTSFYFIREASNREKKQHPLSRLQALTAMQELALPFVQKAEGNSLQVPLREENQRLARSIRETRLRFLNTRGYRISLRETPLGAYGYETIDFLKDPAEREKIIVRLNVLSVPFQAKLDQSLQFDLEGKSFPNPILKEILHHLFLTVLRPTLCDPTDLSQETGEEGGAVVVTRVGHLRLLPQGLRYSAKAIENCAAEEGIDLETLSYERQFQALLAAEAAREEGDIDEYERLTRISQCATTYVKPIKREGEEHMQPVQVPVPNDLLLLVGGSAQSLIN
jgi:hypothetical protein